MPPEKQNALELKTPSIPERVKRDFAEQLAHPCRRDPGTGATLFYVGFDHRGHSVRRWNGIEWGRAFPAPAATIKNSRPAEMPEGAEAPSS